MPDSQNRSVLVQITHDGMGSADQTLSHGLISKWLQLTAQADMLPDVIAFYTDGVKLVCEGSPVLGELRTMQAKGVIWLCVRPASSTLGWRTNSLSG
jgi:hypothetical protein